MMAVVRTTGPPVAWVTDRLRALPSDGLQRAVVLAPGARLAHAIRCHACVTLAAPGLLAGVRLLRPIDLARDILARAGLPARPGGDAVRRARLLALFSRGTLTGTLRYFSAEQLATGHGFVNAFARTIADLEAAGLDPDELDVVAEALAPDDPLAGHRLQDVAATWRAVDEADGAPTTGPQVLVAAAAQLEAHAALASALGPIIAVLPGSPSTALLRLLNALPDTAVVFHDARPIRTGTHRWRARLGLHPPPRWQPGDAGAPVSELHLVQRFAFEWPELLTHAARPRSHGPDGTVDLEEYCSVDEEVDAAAAWVAEQIGAGVALEDIALIVPDTATYAPALQDRLARLANAGASPTVRVHVAGGLPLGASPAGRRVRLLLRAIGSRLASDDTVRLVPFLRRPDQPTPALRERLSPSRAADLAYGAGIAAGIPPGASALTEWVPRLTRQRDALRAALADSPPADETHRLGQERRRMVDRQRLVRRLKDIDAVLPATRALQTLAEMVCGGAPLAAVWRDARAFAERWLRLPAEPHDALDLLDTALGPLLADHAERQPEGLVAVACLVDLLDRTRYPAGRFGDPAVFIGTPRDAAGLSFATVRIMGLAEGALPHTPHDDPIVPDTLRECVERLAQQRVPDVVVPQLADKVLDDVHDTVRVVSGTRERLTLSAPRQWADRSEREVSGIVLEVATALARPGASETAGDDVPTATRLRAVYLHPGRERRQRADTAVTPRRRLLTGMQRDPGTVRVPADWTADPALALDRIHLLTAEARGPAWGALDGDVSAVWPAQQPPGIVPDRPIAATALTLLLTCPYRFLLERILHLAPPPTRPRLDALDPVTYGSLFHAVADAFFREAGPAVCRRDGGLDAWVARARALAAAHFEAVCREYPLCGADAVAREGERLQAQIEQIVHDEWRRPAREFVASELGFGRPDPVHLTLPAGPLYVWGAVDRVDRLGPQALSVRDLKTGRVPDLARQPLHAARDLQLGLYTLAVEQLGLGDGARVTEAAYVHPADAADAQRTFAGTDVDVLRRRTLQWLAVARGLLAAGVLPRTPLAADCSACPFLPACGEGAHERSAHKLAALSADHPARVFARFRQEAADDAG